MRARSARSRFFFALTPAFSWQEKWFAYHVSEVPYMKLGYVWLSPGSCVAVAPLVTGPQSENPSMSFHWAVEAVRAPEGLINHH